MCTLPLTLIIPVLGSLPSLDHRRERVCVGNLGLFGLASTVVVPVLRAFGLFGCLRDLLVLYLFIRTLVIGHYNLHTGCSQ